MTPHVTNRSHQYLLEIGTEELPPGFMSTVTTELKGRLDEVLKQERLEGAVTVWVTPRRIALFLKNLPEKQTSHDVVHKGPPAHIAYDPTGHPTKVAHAFAGKHAIPVDRLERTTLDQEEYVVYREHMAGKPTPHILAEKIPEIVLALNGPRFMRWGDEDIRFARPIRWLVSLWDDIPLPVTIGPLSSGTATYGHRFLCPHPVKIPSAGMYRQALYEQGTVVVDSQERMQKIRTGLTEEAKRLGGVLPEHGELLSTVEKLVEYPWVFTGHFDEGFLNLPKEVIITVMVSHQKYFPVETVTGNLMPCFLVVSNAGQGTLETIRSGNERVLKARLEDARFFFDEDRRTPLKERVPDLKGITFQKGLGTLYDKTQRLTVLAEKIALALGYDASLIDTVKTAAYLSKADLVTNMVFELTELQGMMGRIYGEHEKLSPTVCQALEDQYHYQITPDDPLLHRPVSLAVNLADKLDTLTAVFSQKQAKMPTGSKDPLGLRRMANTVIELVLLGQLRLSLPALITEAHALVKPFITDAADLADVQQRLQEFLMQRLKGILLDHAFRYDMIDAVVDVRNPFENLTESICRLTALKELTQNETAFQTIYEPANRIHRILGNHYRADVIFHDIDISCFQDKAEKTLFEAIKALHNRLDPENPQEYLQMLHPLTPTITQFFDRVLVNDPDENVRRNRYNLLSLLNRYYLQLGNFSKLVIAGDSSSEK